MTDKDIIKALKEILEIMLCEGDLQRSATIGKTLDLINRLKEEIERLQKANERFEKEFDSYYARVKSQAYDEFAERLKDNLNKDISAYGNCTVYDTVQRIDQIAKEMKGEQ